MLLALLTPLAVAEDKRKDFGDGIYSPEKGVICDSKGGYCADALLPLCQVAQTSMSD